MNLDRGFVADRSAGLGEVPYPTRGTPNLVDQAERFQFAFLGCVYVLHDSGGPIGKGGANVPVLIEPNSSVHTVTIGSPD
jgi:hypothetical protein